MKKLLLIIFISLLITEVNGQSNNKYILSKYLETLDYNVANANFEKFIYKDRKDNTSILNDFSQFVNTVKDNSLTNKGLIKKYQSKIKELIEKSSDLTYINGCKNIPFEFVLHDPNKLTFMICGVEYGYEFNTLKNTARQRASKVVVSLLIPAFNKCIIMANIPEIKYIGIYGFYSSRDFLNDDEYHSKDETVIMISPTSDIIKFYNKKITEDELVNNSEFYLSERDVKGVKKIKVSIE